MLILIPVNYAPIILCTLCYFSHELQTCDWPRNVGCDGASAAATGEEELERLIERDPPPPPPPPPRRTPPPPPPPPPRAQPNPVVTSRGQPKFNRQDYEKVFIILTICTSTLFHIPR